MKNIVFLFALLLPCHADAVVSASQTKPMAATSSYQAKAFMANYVVFRNGKDLGTATIKFGEVGNGRWELVTNTIGTGIAAIAGVEVNERSLIRWNEGRPETLDYRFNQKAGWKDKQRSISVNAQNKTIVSQDKENTYTLKYLPGVLDRHAITVAIMQDLSQGKRGDLTYPVADRDELNTHLYRLVGNEKMDTQLGLLESVKVQRIRENANGKTTTLWLAPNKQFIPLRIEQKEGNGDVIEMRISKIVE
ncbi:MAG: DUF3108 domain-containing protein [Arenimonas sp.]